MKETWWLADEARAAIEARGLDVAAWMHAEGAVLSSDRQSAAIHINAQPPLLVKWRAPIPGRRRRAFLRPSRERREAFAMLAATRRGLPCPEPWAVGERRRFGVLQGAVYIRRFDTEAQTAENACLEDASTLVDAARALRAWHDLGFRHGDCYPKNILVGGGGVDPRPIGCPYARWITSGAVIDRARKKDIAQFLVGIPPSLDPEDGARALNAYVEDPGLPSAEALHAQVQPLIEGIMRKKAHRIATRPQREPDGPPKPVPLPPTAGAVRVVTMRLPG